MEREREREDGERERERGWRERERMERARERMVRERERESRAKRSASVTMATAPVVSSCGSGGCEGGCKAVKWVNCSFFLSSVSFFPLSVC